MTMSFRQAGALAMNAAWTLLLIGAAGCSEIDTVEKGSPVLEKLMVYPVPIMHDTQPLGDAMDPMDAPGAVPGASGIAAVFDRILDGSKLETATADGHITPIKGAVTATWSGGPIEMTHRYMPIGVVNTDPGVRPGPSVDAWGEKNVMWSTTTSPGQVSNILAKAWPSGAQVQISLLRAKITSKFNEPFTGVETHVLETLPFKAAFPRDVVAPPASPSDPQPTPVDAARFALTVTFTSVPDPGVAAQIRVSTGGTDVPVDVLLDTTAAAFRAVSVKPRAPDPTTKAWRAGTTYTVTVARDAADLYGVRQTADQIGTFVTMPATAAASVAEGR